MIKIRKKACRGMVMPAIPYPIVVRALVMAIEQSPLGYLVAWCLNLGIHC
jgi:hypothetical protein